MTTRGTPGPTCGARTRNGGTCQKPPLKGATRCANHGGASPRAQAAAADRRAQAAAGRELARIGITTRDIHPAEALIELVQFTAGEVDYWRRRVAQLEDEELTWGRTQHRDGVGPEGPVDVTTREAKPNIAYVMLQQASDRLASYAAAALKAGVEERRVKLAERYGAQVAQAQRTILDRMLNAVVQLLRDHGVDDDQIIEALHRGWAEAMAVIVPEELRRLAGADAA